MVGKALSPARDFGEGNQLMKGIIKGMLFLTAVAVSVSLVADAQGEKTVGQWEPFEVTMTANAAFADAYVEAMPDDGTPYVQVTFTGTGGDALGLSYTVTGFWDGGKNWKARFAPPAPGSQAGWRRIRCVEFGGSVRCARQRSKSELLNQEVVMKRSVVAGFMLCSVLLFAQGAKTQDAPKVHSMTGCLRAGPTTGT